MKPQKLKKDKPVSVGVIGSGAFAGSAVGQFRRVPLLDIPVIAEKDLEVARKAYRQAGLADDEVVVCESREQVMRAIESGRYAITADPMILMDLPLDVIYESTGVPELGARHAMAAVEHGKHVDMVNKEADAVVGPILKYLADRKGVVYSAVYGDQPGLLIGLVLWARSIGLDVVCGGKAVDDEYAWDPVKRTVTTRYSGKMTLSAYEADILAPVPEGPGPEILAARRELLAGLIGQAGWADLKELVIASNATGLAPDIPSVHSPTLYSCEMPRVLCESKDGGILSAAGRIDAVVCLRNFNEAGLGGGVFVIVDGVTDSARRALKATPVRMDGHPVSLITRPYHLYGLDSINTILAAGLYGRATGAEQYLPRYDIVCRSRRDMKAGEIFEMLPRGHAGRKGSIMAGDVEGFFTPARAVEGNVPVPMLMLAGNPLIVDVAKGSVITCEMISPPADSALWDLRERQDRHFLGDAECS